MAFTSISVVTMAALFLLISTLAVQTVATRPVSDGYVAATHTDKSVEPTGGEATTVATNKPAEEYVKPAGGEVTTVATAKPSEEYVKPTGGEVTTVVTAKPAEEYVKPTGGEATTVAAAKPAEKSVDPTYGAKAAEEDYAKAVEITETADKYMKEAATTTSPEKAAFSKKAADLLSGMGKKEITLGNKAAKEDGEQYVTPKNLETLSTEIKEKIQPLSAAGDKSPKPISLLTAATYTHLAEKDLKDAKIATSPEQVVASKKSANDNFISALLYLASGAQGKRPSAAVGTTVHDKTDKQASDAATEIATTYQSNEVSPKEASPKEAHTVVNEKTDKQASDAATENAATYESKDVAPKEASPKDAYTAVDEKTGKQSTDSATEIAATYQSNEAAPKEASPKETNTAVDEKTNKQASDAATENATTYQSKDTSLKEASPKEAYTAVDDKIGKKATDATTETAATYASKDVAPKEAYTAGSA